jgi:hypothetical protein
MRPARVAVRPAITASPKVSGPKVKSYAVPAPPAALGAGIRGYLQTPWTGGENFEGPNPDAVTRGGRENALTGRGHSDIV